MIPDENYETILNRILSKIPEHLDTRPSSPLYMIIAPVVFEIYQYNMNLHWVMDQIFIKTQNFDNLKKYAEQYAIQPKMATKSKIKGKFDKEIPLETVFRLAESEIFFKVVSEATVVDGLYYHELECETAGGAGNISKGKLIPIRGVSGLKVSVCVELLIAAQDDESHDEFLNRFLSIIKNEPYGWNESQYVQFIKALPGVKQCRVMPNIPANANDYNVIVYIVGADGLPATTELLGFVEEALVENIPYTHYPQVTSPGVDAPSIAATITIQNDGDWNNIKTAIENEIINYISEVTNGWGESKESLLLRISAITTAITNVSGVVDVTGVKINGQQTNYVATLNNIIVPGGFTITKSP